MDANTYVDIFSTKGIEYLIVISFFLLFIPFLRMVREIQRPVFSLADLRLPKGVYFNPTHMWGFLEANGKMAVGADDFLANITGPMNIRYLKKPGDEICQGEVISILENGDRTLNLYAPASGVISRKNNPMRRHFGQSTDPDFTNNWLYKITPMNWDREKRNLLMGSEAKTWISNELGRLRDFLTFADHKYSGNLQPILLQEGGQIKDQVLTELSPEVWQEFQVEFLDAAKIEDV